MSEQDDKAMPPMMPPVPPMMPPVPPMMPPVPPLMPQKIPLEMPPEDPALPVDGPPELPAYKEKELYPSQEDYIAGARYVAEDMNSGKSEFTDEENSKLAGIFLKNAGIDADTNHDGKFSKDEINSAIMSVPGVAVPPDVPPITPPVATANPESLLPEDPALPVDGPPTPPAYKEEALSPSREDYIAGARYVAEQMKSEKDRTVKQGYADIAGNLLEQAGIDADTNQNGKFSTREIKDAIKGLPKLESQDVPKANEAEFKSAPNAPEPVATARGNGIG